MTLAVTHKFPRRGKIENDWLVGGKQGIEVTICKSMRMFGCGHKLEQIDHIDKTDLQLRELLA
jgi:hypothetical protein